MASAQRLPRSPVATRDQAAKTAARIQRDEVLGRLRCGLCTITAAALSITAMLRQEPGVFMHLAFGLQARGDLTVPCCKPSDAALNSTGDGTFRLVKNTIKLAQGCDISLCQPFFQLLTPGTVHLDDVHIAWT